MRLNRKTLEDKSEDDRQKVLAYKKCFSSEEGKHVLFDLMNRYHILNPTPVGQNNFQQGKFEGQRTVVLDILSRCNVNMAEFDKIIRGEF